MTFWIVTSALALAVSALLGLAVLRSRGDAVAVADFDLRVYRDQLRDIDRDLARGVIAVADAERIRTEVSRRILAADAKHQAETVDGAGQPGPSSRVLVAVLTFAVVAGSLALYSGLGAPGYGDLGLQHRIERAEFARLNRPRQAEAEARIPATPRQDLTAEYLALVEKLRETVAQRPDDLQGQRLLARNEAASGNYAAAHAAQARALELAGEQAAAADYADLADLLIQAAGGYVSPEAEAALRAALERDPRNGTGRYYWGLMMAQTGRPDVAFRLWSQLLLEGPHDAPWIEPIRAQIEEMAFHAGVEYALPPTLPPPTLPPPPRGPSQADIDAAGNMSDDDRMQMIRGMVQGLSDRLATEGGPPPDWARLIGALGVLGETDQARAIYLNAQEAFAGDTAALAVIADAARQAGLTE